MQGHKYWITKFYVLFTINTGFETHSRIRQCDSLMFRFLLVNYNSRDLITFLKDFFGIKISANRMDYGFSFCYFGTGIGCKNICVKF